MTVDLANQDPEFQAESTDIIRDTAAMGARDLFFFARAICGYKDMTPSVHGPICTFFTENPSQFKRALYPRDHFKSSVITIAGNLQRVVRNPDERIHIKNERAENSSRFLQAIQAHCTANARFRTFYSHLVPADTRKVRWNDTEMDLLGRSGIYPEPTISCSGYKTATTSNHFSHITWDDPISEDAVHSDKVMDETWQRMKSSLSLLSKPERDTIWIVGTRWGYNDVYARWDKTYGRRTAKLSRSALEDGKPIFPELISLEFLDMQRAADPYLFSCNYMNNPRDPERQAFDIGALMRWAWVDDEYRDQILVYDPRTNEPLAIVPVEKLDITVTCDLAVSEKKTSDRNAIVVMGTEPTKGFCIILECVAKRITPVKVVDELLRINDQWHPRVIGIEAVAYQKALKYFLEDAKERLQQEEKRWIYLPIKDLKAVGKKEIRIWGIQPLVKTGRVAVAVDQQVLIQEMDDYPLGEHDDAIDALSMQTQVANHWFSPERIAKLQSVEDRLLRAAGYRPAEDDTTDRAIEEYWHSRVGRWANVTNELLAR